MPLEELLALLLKHLLLMYYLEVIIFNLMLTIALITHFYNTTTIAPLRLLWN